MVDDEGVLEDGSYDVLVVDANRVEGAVGVVSLDLAIVGGEVKGEMVSVRATGLAGDPVMFLGLPGTLTVTGGVPAFALDP